MVGALIGMDFPEEEARYYEQQLKAGRVLVGVKAGDRNGEAMEILRRPRRLRRRQPAARSGGDRPAGPAVIAPERTGRRGLTSPLVVAFLLPIGPNAPHEAAPWLRRSASRCRRGRYGLPVATALRKPTRWTIVLDGASQYSACSTSTRSSASSGSSWPRGTRP